MTTLEIPDKDLIITIPSHWDEMAPSDIHYCLMQALIASAGHQTPLQVQVKCFYRLAGIKPNWKTIIWERIMPAHIVQQKNANANAIAKQTITFLFTDIPASLPVTTTGASLPVGQTGDSLVPKLEINYNTIFNHFQSLKIPSRIHCGTPLWLLGRPPILPFLTTTFHGPSDLLSDLTFAEFRTALEEMNDYFTDKDEHNLSRMIACLYRPERQDYQHLTTTETFDGNRRQPFNRNLIEQNAKAIDRMHPVHRTAILLWFTYTVQYIQTTDITISGHTINLSPLFPKKTPVIASEAKQSSKGSGWTPILYHIAKEGIFGNAEATDRTGLFDILLYMYGQYQDAKRTKSKSK